jgi:hypothetical protein
MADETQIAKGGLNDDRGGRWEEAEYLNITPKMVLYVFGTWQIWIYSLQSMCAGSGVYAFVYFTPLILQGLGYNAVDLFHFQAPQERIFCDEANAQSLFGGGTHCQISPR